MYIYFSSYRVYDYDILALSFTDLILAICSDS